ncbi:hypothetical protein OJ997_24545, partial [Solirubrobacter phytolaccae]
MADAAPAVGMGHVSRCSALAAAYDGPARCLAYDAPGPFERDGVAWEPWNGPLSALRAELAVIDGYRFEAVADVAARLPVAIFHDGGPVPANVALVIAPIAGEETTQGGGASAAAGGGAGAAGAAAGAAAG